MDFGIIPCLRLPGSFVFEGDGFYFKHCFRLHANIFTISSELVQLKLNIETSVGDSTPTEAEKWKLHLIEGGVLELG